MPSFILITVYSFKQKMVVYMALLDLFQVIYDKIQRGGYVYMALLDLIPVIYDTIQGGGGVICLHGLVGLISGNIRYNMFTWPCWTYFR